MRHGTRGDRTANTPGRGGVSEMSYFFSKQYAKEKYIERGYSQENVGQVGHLGMHLPPGVGGGVA